VGDHWREFDIFDIRQSQELGAEREVKELHVTNREISQRLALRSCTHQFPILKRYGLVFRSRELGRI
jgi:hypothetical protein